MEHNTNKLDKAIAACFCENGDTSDLDTVTGLNAIRDAFKDYAESHLHDVLECLDESADRNGGSIHSAAGLSSDFSLFECVETLYQPIIEEDS